MKDALEKEQGKIPPGEDDMNLLSRVAVKSSKRQPAAGKFFLLGTAIVLFMVVGPGVGRSISMQQNPCSLQLTTSVKPVKLPAKKYDQVDIRYRQLKDRAEQHRVATQLQDGKITIDPVKRKKIAFLLLLAGGQARNIHL